MSAKFGTSGLRGLVRDLSADVVQRYTQAFLTACDTGGQVYIGRDLRDSSPQIAQAVAEAICKAGCDAVDCGAVPTPALALAASEARCGAVMVTGSHIPADRNGLKFYSTAGEITKADEAAILKVLEGAGEAVAVPAPGRLVQDDEVAARFQGRYQTAFGAEALQGMRIGLYAHSAVGRDLLADILTGLGASVTEFGRSETFIPIDTEAVGDDLRLEVAQWVTAAGLDALVSTDGDSDRPLLADETGRIVAGDIMGQITARVLRAKNVVTPVSSNSGVTLRDFERVILTRIGSPYVISAMQQAGGDVVGYEANGGFLLGFDAAGPVGPLPALVTRDSVLPLIVTLGAARGRGVAALVAAEPPVTTRSGRLENVAPAQSQRLLERLEEDRDARARFLSQLGLQESAVDVTDGLRISVEGGGVVHLRPSGNAPEFRVYVEHAGDAGAEALLKAALALVERLFQTEARA